MKKGSISFYADNRNKKVKNKKKLNMTLSNSTRDLHPKNSLNYPNNNDMFKYYIELNKNLNKCVLKNNLQETDPHISLNTARIHDPSKKEHLVIENTSLMICQRGSINRNALLLFEKIFEFIKMKITAEKYEELKQFFSIEYENLYDLDNSPNGSSHRKHSSSSINDILKNLCSRKMTISTKRSIEKSSSQVNICKLKQGENTLGDYPANFLKNNNVCKTKKNSRVENKIYSNGLKSNWNNKDIAKSYKSLNYGFDYNRKSLPFISTNISINDYYNKNNSISSQQFKNKLLSPNYILENVNVLVEKNKLNSSKINTNVYFSNNINSKYITNTTQSCENNSTILCNKDIKTTLESNNSNKNNNKTNENTTVSINKNLNNNLMSFLAKNNKKNLNSYRNKVSYMTKNQPIQEKMKSTLRNQKNNLIAKDSKHVPKKEKNKESIYLASKIVPTSSLLQSAHNIKTCSNILPTEISINIKDFSDLNCFPDDMDKIESKSKKTLIDKLSENDPSTKTQASNIKSRSINNNIIDNTTDNSNRFTYNYNTLTDRKCVVHTHTNHQKHSSVVESKYYLNEIKLNIDDNLKNLFNFSYENFYYKDKDHSDLISNSDDDKRKNMRKQVNESQLNEFQTEELNNKNDIMYTNEISFDEVDEKLKNIVFRKK